MINAMCLEIEGQREYLKDQSVDTLYFGGGTPSALPLADLKRLVDTVKESFDLDANAEVTLEANPDDIKTEFLIGWNDIGINRLSIGIQAFQDELLSNWNRSHNASQASSAIALAQEAGFSNITADLIYGGPELTDEDWQENIQRLIDSGIPHISSYALTVEPNTALAYQIKKGTYRQPDDEQANQQYSILQSKLSEAGFLQYEVSNFSKPKYESRHNKNYWTGAHYLGIGPSAHSFNGKSRQWNIANNVKYIKSLDEGKIPFEEERLTPAQQFNELVMTGLRTSMGIDLKRIKLLGEEFENQLQTDIQYYLDQGKVFVNEAGNWTLDPEHYFFADGIASDLFIVDEG